MATWGDDQIAKTPLTLSDITAKLFGRQRNEATGYDPNTGQWEFANASTTQQYNPFSSDREGAGINSVDPATRDPRFQTPTSQWGVPNTSGSSGYNPNLPGGFGVNRNPSVPTGSTPLPSYGNPGGAGVNPTGRGTTPLGPTSTNPIGNRGPNSGINTTGFTPTPSPDPQPKLNTGSPYGPAPWQPGERSWGATGAPDFGPKPPGSKIGDASLIQQNAVNRAGQRTSSGATSNPLLNTASSEVGVPKTGNVGNNPLVRGGQPSTPPPNNTNTQNNSNTVIGPDGRTWNRNPNIPQGNWNQNDPNNPLRNLIPQGASPWGNAGGLLWGGQGNPSNVYSNGVPDDIVWDDPRYYERYWHTFGGDNGGGEYRYRLKPQVGQRLNGRVQVGLAGVGGDTHNVKDPSLVEWDDEFGLVTPAWNVVQDANVDWQDTALFATIGGILGGATGAHAFGINQGTAPGFDINPNTGGIGGTAGTTPGGVPWGTPTGPGGTPAPSGGNPQGNTPNTPPPGSGTPGNNGVTPPSGTPNPGPAGTVSGGSAPGWLPDALKPAWNAGQMVWNGTRWVLGGMSLINTISGITGNGPVFGNNSNRGPGSNSNSGPGSNSNGGFDLSDIIRGGVGLYNDNRNLDWFQDQTNDLMDRGDFARGYRPAWMDRLNDFMLDPEKALQDPTYKAVRERGLDNLSRKLNARGYNMSGNEMGELQQYGQEMDWKQIQKERESLMNAVKLGDPSGMASAALRNLPFIFAARGNRNFDAMNGLGGLLNYLFGNRGNNSSGNPVGNSGGNRPNLPGGSNGGGVPGNDDPEDDTYFPGDPHNDNEEENNGGYPFTPINRGDDGQDERDSTDGNYDEDWWNWFFGED